MYTLSSPAPLLLLLLLSVCFHLKAATSEEEEEPEDTPRTPNFQPTPNWQPLHKDQPVPRGVHVKVNLQTGERHVKLLDPKEDEDDKGESRMSAIRSEETTAPPPLPEELNRVLKSMDDPDQAFRDEDFQWMRKKFRSYEELKREMQKIKMAVKTDVQIMNELIESYKEKVDPKVRSSASNTRDSTLESEEAKILLDLEYLLHYIENANEFVRINGIVEVVFPSLNSTSSQVRYEATKLLGSAVQNNPTAQIGALQSGTIAILLKTIALDSSPKVQSGALYALSCLVRRFPAAQSKLIESGGLAALAKLFQGDSSDLLKLQIRVVTLFNDLIEEKESAEVGLFLARNGTNSTLLDEEEERLRQYKAIGLEGRLVEGGWCPRLANLLVAQGITWSSEMRAEDMACASDPDTPLREEHDTIEKLLNGMLHLVHQCKEPFTKTEVAATIKLLASWYYEMAARENDPNGSFALLFQTIDNLTKKLDISYKTTYRDEL